MNTTIISILLFVLALFIGIYFGKLYFSACFKSEKASLEEKLNGLLSQIEIQKQQFAQERINLDKQITQSNQEKEAIRSDKDALAILLDRKSVV